MITHSLEQLHKVLDYNPTSGIFTWKVQRRCGTRGWIRIGDEAGSVNDRGYRIIIFEGRHYRAHRLAFFFTYGIFPPKPWELDHINGDRLDNRIENLRVASRTQNHANRRARKSISGMKGIHKQGRRWAAQISVQGKRHFLGSFGTPEQAHTAYVSAAKKFFGPFARAA